MFIFYDKTTYVCCYIMIKLRYNAAKVHSYFLIAK